MLIRTKYNGYQEVKTTLVWIALAAVLLFGGLLGFLRLQGAPRDTIRDAMKSGEDTVELKGGSLSTDELGGLCWGDPAMFHVNGISYKNEDGKTVYTFSYNSFAADYDKHYAEYRKLLSGLASDIRGKMREGDGEREILRLIHDEIVNRYSYDESLTVRHAYGMMRTGSGVCSAYTQLFLALCDEFGFECHYLLSRSMDHAWNLVRVDGKFLHVDCTWDDPVGESPTDTYFLLSDEEIRANGHSGWVDVTALVEPDLRGAYLAFYMLIGVFVLSVLILVVRIVLAKKRGKNGEPRCVGKCTDEELLLAMARARALSGESGWLNGDGMEDSAPEDAPPDDTPPDDRGGD